MQLEPAKFPPSEGEALSRILDTHAKVLELTEFEQRLKAVEESIK